ncbi:hypothetical protein BU24DRAFT_357005 [Aaosphaeria arxii CBS 175.79]|uniref:Fumarylacetoacetase n=1 Tax=Aaosphaeria arxii CBS 175.79 TaxID=1450172 RepID=A0A6A5XB31_9PLEO|nr:uncharacterized protein BU24DRAFT_357005 [Aaosphaeria arxii CBS 175.79]KAF2010172.1 hypothetical protein BU24DRAFT_357005 [Aaosphaeria arxii CBS 175.79]
MATYPFPIPHDSPFPMGNIPFGIFSTEAHQTPRPGVALGDFVLDLQELIALGLEYSLYALTYLPFLLPKSSLNQFTALAPSLRRDFRSSIQSMIHNEASVLYKPVGPGRRPAIVPGTEAKMHLPMRIGSFTDFMCSLEHVQTVGKLAGYPTVPPNFYHIPLAYNGRASSIIVSGQDLPRPIGMLPGSDIPYYSHSRKLDYEVEMGVFISQEIPYGESVNAATAREHIFGFVLMNDWSARDIQFYEMTPLGPFNGKAAGTSISPWIVTLDALEEAGALIVSEARGLVGGKNTMSPFLQCPYDISAQVRHSGDGGSSKEMLGISDLKHLHWSPFQMLAHQSSSACGISTGDLFGTGTLSSTVEQSGCLQEIVSGGQRPMKLSDGSELTWLEDGDTVIMEAWAGSRGKQIGFGELRTLVTPGRTPNSE